MAAQASEVDKRSSSASDMSNVQIDEEVSVPDVEVKHSPFQSQTNLRTGVLTSEEVKELGDQMRKERAKKYFSLRVCTYYVWKILHRSIVFEDFERSFHVGKLKVWEQLQNTPQLIYMSLNKNSVYCVMPRSSKPPDTCKWGGNELRGILKFSHQNSHKSTLWSSSYAHLIERCLQIIHCFSSWQICR